MRIIGHGERKRGVAQELSMLYSTLRSRLEKAKRKMQLSVGVYPEQKIQKEKIGFAIGLLGHEDKPDRGTIVIIPHVTGKNLQFIAPTEN